MRRQRRTRSRERLGSGLAESHPAREMTSQFVIPTRGDGSMAECQTFAEYGLRTTGWRFSPCLFRPFRDNDPQRSTLMKLRRNGGSSGLSVLRCLLGLCPKPRDLSLSANSMVVGEDALAGRPGGSCAIFLLAYHAIGEKRKTSGVRGQSLRCRGCVQTRSTQEPDEPLIAPHAQIFGKNLPIAARALSGLSRASQPGPDTCGPLDLPWSRVAWSDWETPGSTSLLAPSMTAYLCAAGPGEMHSSAAGSSTDGFLWIKD